MNDMRNIQDETSEDSQAKKPYIAPAIVAQGRVEDLTQLIGGRWGESLIPQGPAGFWTAWKTPGDS